jgi:nucleoside-diphosphate-sugar epimerase
MSLPHSHLQDSSQVNEIISKGTSAVIHTASMLETATTDVGLMRDINVKGTRHVVEACQANGVQALIYTSTGGCLRCTVAESAYSRSSSDHRDYDRCLTENRMLSTRHCSAGRWLTTEQHHELKATLRSTMPFRHMSGSQ